jgi:hypothetical protein
MFRKVWASIGPFSAAVLPVGTLTVWAEDA